MTETAHLSIDRSICSGHGRCYAMAPELFGSDDDEGRGEVVVHPNADQLAAARRAILNCPERAISLELLNTEHEEKV